MIDAKADKVGRGLVVALELGLPVLARQCLRLTGMEGVGLSTAGGTRPGCHCRTERMITGNHGVKQRQQLFRPSVSEANREQAVLLDAP